MNNNFSISAKHHRKNSPSFPFNQQRLSRETRCPPLQGCHEMAQYPHWNGVREDQVGCWDFYPYHIVVGYPHCGVNGDHIWGRDFHTHLAVTWHPSPPHWDGIIGGLAESQSLCHCPVAIRLLSPWYQWIPREALELSHLPSGNREHPTSGDNEGQVGNLCFYL